MAEPHNVYDEFKEKIFFLEKNIKEKKEEEVKTVQEGKNLLLQQLERVKATFDDALEQKNSEIAELNLKYQTLEEKAEEEALLAQNEIKQMEKECKALKYDIEKITQNADKMKAEYQEYKSEKEEQVSQLENKQEELLQAVESQRQVIEKYSKKVQELQKLVEHLQSRHVPLLKDAKRNHAITFLEKNNGDKERPYLAVIGTFDEIRKEIALLKDMRRYPSGKVFSIMKVPNGITYFNWLRENEYIECDPNDERHFKLGNRHFQSSLEDLLSFETPCPDVQECIDLFTGDEEENDSN